MSADETTQENQADRVAWLRERGVQIEFAKGDPDAVEEGKAAAKPGGRPVTIIKIPCNDAEPYEECTLHVSESVRPTDELMDLLKVRFAGNSTTTIDQEKLREATKSLLHNNPQAANLTVSQDALAQMLQGEGHVEAFPLTRPSKENNWMSVSFYLDEVGQLKHLSNNARAAAIARYCGFENVALAGDMYIARTRKQEGKGGIRTESFSLSEVDSSSPWMCAAEVANYARGVSSGRVAYPQEEQVATPEQDPSKPYSWSQNDEEVEVQLRLEAGKGKIAKKEMDITIGPASLTVAEKSGAVLMDIALHARIRPDDSTWTISGDSIEFTLEKVNESAWKQLEA